jgi:arylsulfatase A-like enzyme
MKPHCLLLSVLLGAFGGSNLAAEKPNIIFILADDLGYGDLSCYGQKRLATPNLDRMAAEGMRFTRHYAGLTVCAPSRCVLMTGKHTGHAVVRTNYDTPMLDGTRTLAGLLQSAGYATGAFGKWGIGDVIPEDDPLRKGFDTFYGYVDMYHAHNFFPPYLIRDGKREPLRNTIIPGSDGTFAPGRGNGVAQEKIDYAPALIVDEALEFIEAKAKEPFFLYLALNTPHANNEGGKGDFQRGMEVPAYGPFADRDWPDHEKGFARMMHDIDDTAARVLEKLRALGIAENTLVIFTSDNGPHQEGGHEVEFFDSNGPLKGRKRDLYEGGIRVPLIAWWPGKVPDGTVSDHLSGFQDWMPTFAELVGVEAPDHNGLSLLPTLQGRTESQARHDHLYFEFYEGGGKQAIVTERWKAVRLDWNENPDAPLELYDLENDPAEEHNLAAQHPDLVKTMLARTAASHVPHAGVTLSPKDRATKK